MASVDHQRNLPSYPDIMQKIKLLDVIRGAPGATLANYAQPLEETAYLMVRFSSLSFVSFLTSFFFSPNGPRTLVLSLVTLALLRLSPMSPTSLLSSRMFTNPTN